MKKVLISITIMILFSISTMAQSALTGAWQATQNNKHIQLYFIDGFFFHTIHQDKEFISTMGGTFTANKDAINALFLFNSANDLVINQNVEIAYSIINDKLTLTAPDGILTFNKVDNGQAPLAGVWKITHRMNADGNVVPIHQTGTRHTYKLLTGKKFQWVAIDPSQKLFNGTGGGSYTFKDGKYIETIEFFSRDNNRVGASLSFDGKLENGKWHHSGLSSKGDKIHEIWGRVNDK